MSELTQTLEANVEASAATNRQSLRALAMGLKKKPEGEESKG